MVNPPPDIVVRFAAELGEQDRAGLLDRLGRLDRRSRVGMDLGHRGPSPDALTITLAVINTVELAPAELAAVGFSARNWAKVAGGRTHARVEVVNRETGAMISFAADDPDHAITLAHRAVAAMADDGLLVWTGADWQQAAEVEAPVPKHILAVADEWFPRRGGISAFNRYLCTALARAASVVTCVVPESTTEERADAEERGVRLVRAPDVPGATDRERLSMPPALLGGIEPDIVIGHGRITGSPALALAATYDSKPARLHFIHMQPDQIEWHKLDRDDDTATRAEQRTQEEAALGREATRIVAVGPTLHDFAKRDLTDDTTPIPVRLDPGFDGAVANPPLPKDGRPLVLLLGRMEDASVKGVVLAAQALGHAIRAFDVEESDVELLVRGSPTGEADALRASILRWARRPGLRATVRNFTGEPDSVLADIRRSSLVLMPSLEEGFGLVGLEAIATGVPTLVSERSGLGALLRELAAEHLDPQLSSCVVPVRLDKSDTARWANRIAGELRDRDAAFRRAHQLRIAMAGVRDWAQAARTVLAAAGD